MNSRIGLTCTPLIIPSTEDIITQEDIDNIVVTPKEKEYILRRRKGRTNRIKELLERKKNAIEYANYCQKVGCVNSDPDVMLTYLDDNDILTIEEE